MVSHGTGKQSIYLRTRLPAWAFTPLAVAHSRTCAHENNYPSNFEKAIKKEGEMAAIHKTVSTDKLKQGSCHTGLKIWTYHL